MSPEPCPEQPLPGFSLGIKQFNQGEYFECHEILEELWMAEARPIRRFYQGILQIGVAFHHLKAGRYRPAVTLLVRGSGYLRAFAPVCMGVDVAGLLAAIDRCLGEVKRLGPEGVGDFDWSLIPLIEPGE